MHQRPARPGQWQARGGHYRGRHRESPRRSVRIKYDMAAQPLRSAAGDTDQGPDLAPATTGVGQGRRREACQGRHVERPDHHRRRRTTSKMPRRSWSGTRSTGCPWSKAANCSVLSPGTTSSGDWGAKSEGRRGRHLCRQRRESLGHQGRQNGPGSHARERPLRRSLHQK